MSVYREIRERRRRQDEHDDAVSRLRPITWRTRIYALAFCLLVGYSFRVHEWIQQIRWRDEASRSLLILSGIVIVCVASTWWSRERAWRRLMRQVSPETLDEIEGRDPTSGGSPKIDAVSVDNRKGKKAAEPGATDNPDDAQRLREDH